MKEGDEYLEYSVYLLAALGAILTSVIIFIKRDDIKRCGARVLRIPLSPDGRQGEVLSLFFVCISMYITIGLPH